MCTLYTVPTDTVAVFQTAGVGRSVAASPMKAFQDPAEDEHPSPGAQCPVCRTMPLQ
jgi:hypothetical protein